MPLSAWLMLIFGSLVLFGGLALCLRIAFRHRKPMPPETSSGDFGPPW